ncbi:MAG: hypothetical protein AAF581_11995 [Planctomycetota bacterium]
MNLHRAIPVALAFFAALTLVSCNRDNKPVVRTSTSESTFLWDARLDDDNDVEEFEMLFRDPQAEVEVETIDLEGAVEIEIFDDDNDRIFAQRYDGPRNGREIDIDESDFGEQGEWTIRITTIGATGAVVIHIEPKWEQYE